METGNDHQLESLKHTCDSTAVSKKIQFSKPVCPLTVAVNQTTVFENFHNYVGKLRGIMKTPI